jgi:hypothetical protein
MTYEDKRAWLARLDRSYHQPKAGSVNVSWTDLSFAIKELEKAWSALDMMRSALEFYADERNYERYWVDGITDSCKVEEDEGKKAREALNE